MARANSVDVLRISPAKGIAEVDIPVAHDINQYSNTCRSEVVQCNAHLLSRGENVVSKAARSGSEEGLQLKQQVRKHSFGDAQVIPKLVIRGVVEKEMLIKALAFEIPLREEHIDFALPTWLRAAVMTRRNGVDEQFVSQDDKSNDDNHNGEQTAAFGRQLGRHGECDGLCPKIGPANPPKKVVDWIGQIFGSKVYLHRFSTLSCELKTTENREMSV